MGNTVFFRNIQQDASQIGWRDIFSDYKKKHDKQDLEYALAAGTSLNTASEEYMLQKWRKPWVFYPVSKWGLILMLLLYIAFFGLQFGGFGISSSMYEMTVIIPPLIPPIIMLLLFWEMNIPRNISIYELLGMWLVGGLISFVVVSILFIFIPEDLPACIGAPLREEPAKLIASIIILILISRKKKLYGITGFVVGAAVGAGFAAFESVSYALSATNEGASVLWIHFFRLMAALGGHILFCAPYSAEISRHSENNRITLGSIFNMDSLGAFFVACILHGLWDTDKPGGFLGMLIASIILISLIWIQGIRILRKCLNQVVRIGTAASNGAALQHGAGESFDLAVNAVRVDRPDKEKKGSDIIQNNAVPKVNAETIKLTCNSGELKGISWQAGAGEALFVGRDNSCKIRFSPSAQGVSGRHCSIQLTQFGWTVKDLNSTYGTTVSGNQKILPGTEVKLKQGDVISLGGSENTLTVNFL